jgi:hypothetical protein
MRIHTWVSADGNEEKRGISVSEAKRLLKEFGGVAGTEFYDRDGTFLGIRDIELKENNTTKVKLSNAPYWKKLFKGGEDK